VGVEADHNRNEAGWPAALGAANSPYTYLALESMTGTPQSWYVSAFETYAEEGESLKQGSQNPALQAELDRLWKADAQYLTGSRQIQAIGRPDLSHGTFPTIADVRFFEITQFRVRLGHEAGFEAAAKAYAAAAARGAPGINFRVYQVVAGLNGSNYLIFSSHIEYAEFDDVLASGPQIFGAATTEETSALNSAMSNDVQTTFTNRYRLNPTASYVSDEVRATDPDFWKPGR
jgi:hypothetical protein